MRKITLDEFKNYTFLSGIDHAPGGKFAAFAVHKVDLYGNNG